jgi:hypothetical protein
LLDGTERLGIVEMAFDEPAITERTIMVGRRAPCTPARDANRDEVRVWDAFEATRRQRPMTIASELLWQLAPPLVFATDRLVLAGVLEPCYDNRGDALDYAVNDGVLHVGVFDAWATASRRPRSRHSPSRSTGTGAVAAAGCSTPTPRWTMRSLLRRSAASTSSVR